MAAKWESQKKGFLDDSEWINRAKSVTGETTDSTTDDIEPVNSRVSETLEGNGSNMF